MKIQNWNIIIGLGFMSAMVGVGAPFIKEDIENSRKKYQDNIEYVATNNPQRYEQMKNDTSPSVWANEAQKTRDSLRIDSLVKRAYFEGAQMVRDSIKNAEICQK